MNSSANNLKELGRGSFPGQASDENSPLNDTLFIACETLSRVPDKPGPDSGPTKAVRWYMCFGLSCYVYRICCNRELLYPLTSECCLVTRKLSDFVWFWQSQISSLIPYDHHSKYMCFLRILEVLKWGA